MELKLVSFELAKKLKEVGFDIEVRDHWSTHNDMGNKSIFLRIHEELFKDNYNYATYSPYISNREEELFSAPTLELAKMWFWSKDIRIYVIPSKYINFDTAQNEWIIITKDDEIYSGNHHSTPEGSLEEALLEACALIKTK